jgi:hypothetical protein
MKKARWIVYGVTVLLLAVAVLNVLLFSSPDWFREVVLQATVVALVALGLLAAALEYIARNTIAPRAPLYLLAFAIPPMLLTAGYLFAAAWLGRANAAANTWHLLSLFVIINFVFLLLMGALAMLLVRIVIAVRGAS